MRRAAAAGVAAALAVSFPHPSHALVDVGGLFGGGGGGGIDCIGGGDGGLLDKAKDVAGGFIKGAINKLVPGFGSVAGEALDAGGDGACEIVETEPGATQAELVKANQRLEAALLGIDYDDPASIARDLSDGARALLREHAATSSRSQGEGLWHRVYAPEMPEVLTPVEADAYVVEAEVDAADAALNLRRLVGSHGESLDGAGDLFADTSAEAVAAEGIRGVGQAGVQATLLGADIDRRSLELDLAAANVAQAERDRDRLGREVARRALRGMIWGEEAEPAPDPVGGS